MKCRPGTEVVKPGSKIGITIQLAHLSGEIRAQKVISGYVPPL